MANICRGCFMFFGKRESVLQAIKTNNPPKKYYNLSENASRIAYMTGDMTAPDEQFLEQLKGWMLTSSKDFSQLKEGNNSLLWTTYNGDVSKRCIFNKNEPTEDDIAFFNDWLEEQSRTRRNELRGKDFASLLHHSQASEKEKTKESTASINIEDLFVQLQIMMDTPRLALVNDWDLRCAINREILGNRSDLYREYSNWIEYEDDYVLYSATSDYKWWCAVDGTQPVSVIHPDVFVGVAYLEEQGIFGQRIYHNGIEILKTVGPAGTLPDDCTELVHEYGETYRRIKWEYTMNWQVELVKEAMCKQVGISQIPINSTSEDDNV